MFKVGDWVVRKADSQTSEWRCHAKEKFNKPLQITAIDRSWLKFDSLPGTEWWDKLFDPTSPPAQKSFNLHNYL